jgi:hypothetical protein
MTQWEHALYIKAESFAFDTTTRLMHSPILVICIIVYDDLNLISPVSCFKAL